MPFPGVPCGAGCRERSQRSCLRPGGLPSLTRNPGLAATVPVEPPLSRRGLRSRHPGKRPPGCKGQRRFGKPASRRCGGPARFSVRCIHLFKPCPDSRFWPWSDAPAAKVLKKVMVNTGGNKRQVRKTSKPRLPKLKNDGAENQREEKADEYPKYPR
ncbi:Uncharacterised protein [Escherichia coli]|uniref:Single-stranded DNA-binding protein n=1 Tax=Escherichia coli TaxID=562 RepID=A0AAX2KJI6_ECOLX|nr:Uncharacterised protein [Escherichia coli]